MTNFASPDKFELVFAKLPTSDNIIDNRTLTLNLFDTIIPGVSFGLTSNNWQNFKMSSITEDISFNPLTINFTVDENFENWQLLLNWLFFINNNKNVATKQKNEYETDASLLLYDNFDSNILNLKFNGIFPYDLGDITMSYRDSETYLTCSCTFGYDYFEINV